MARFFIETTVMVMRMLQREQSFYLQRNSYEQKPTQIMLTVSRNLCDAINEYYSKLRKSILSPDEEAQDFQENVNLPVKPSRMDDLGNPAFVCFSDFLAIMDSQLKKPLLVQNRRATNPAGA